MFCLYRACFTHLISSNLSCNPCLWYYDQLVHFDKEINANVYRHSLWEYYKRFHCSFEWHLTPHTALYIESCIRRTPCISGHYSLPRGCPLTMNTGFTVFFFTLSYNNYVLRAKATMFTNLSFFVVFVFLCRDSRHLSFIWICEGDSNPSYISIYFYRQP